ncbi:MAG: SRPBCC domain-containing protein [Minisyncoccota bacterium]
MKQQDYTATIDVSVTAQRAFEGIGRVSEWWAKDVEGSSEKLNDTFTVRFGETFVTFKIIEAVADKKVVWLVTDCNLHWLKDKQEWRGTKIVWEASTSNDAMHITFMHIGLVPDIACYEGCAKGWDFYVKESLFKLLTEGKGLPDAL